MFGEQVAAVEGVDEAVRERFGPEHVQQHDDAVRGDAAGGQAHVTGQPAGEKEARIGRS